jgi:hypothetical protein
MKKLFIIYISFLVFSFASIPATANVNQTLVVGIIIQHGTGYKYYGGVSVNGTNKNGIEITMQEIKNGNTYTMKTQNDGSFFSFNIPEGTYKVTKIYLENRSGSCWASMTWTPLGNNTFNIINGKINNFGTIYWDCNRNIRNYVSCNQDYGQVRDLFNGKYLANWNLREWININITFSN